MAHHKRYSPLLGKTARWRRIARGRAEVEIMPDTSIDYELL